MIRVDYCRTGHVWMYSPALLYADNKRPIIIYTPPTWSVVQGTLVGELLLFVQPGVTVRYCTKREGQSVSTNFSHVIWHSD